MTAPDQSVELPGVSLPWPDRVLHPNQQSHWAKKAQAIKIARHAAAWEAKRAWAGKQAALATIHSQPVTVTAIFFPPDNRRRDLDGMLSSIKPALDGIADVLGVDDSKWSLALRKEAPEAPGLVRIEISIVERAEA